jgi:hypothetical protein
MTVQCFRTVRRPLPFGTREGAQAGQTPIRNIEVIVVGHLFTTASMRVSSRLFRADVPNRLN